MKVFLDTNVIIDVLAAREPFFAEFNDFAPRVANAVRNSRFGTACHRCSHLLRKLGFASADMTPCASLGGRGH